MNVRELNQDQLCELKEAFATENANGEISWGELIEAHNIPDEIIFSFYDGIEFVNDDFFCTMEGKQ